MQNSVHSVYMSLDRPAFIGELYKLRMQHGDKFPYININYFSSFKVLRFPGDFPLVLKAAHSEAGNHLN